MQTKISGTRRARNMSAMRSSAVHKPQFGPWLIEQVESGQYEGLHMIGNDIFRIPWKHNARKNLEDEDIKIFKEWAVVSGKIYEYPDDKAKWKTNFRCALSGQKIFQKLQDNSKDRDDPHKIFRIIRPQNHQESQNAEPIQDQQFIHQMYVDQMPHNVEQELLDQMVTMDLNKQHAAYQESFPSIYDLEITISYRRTEVLKTCLRSQIVQLYYQWDNTELTGQPIPFPSTQHLVDQKQVQYTQRLLDNIQRGLQLEINQHGIYGFRQAKCQVFVCTGNPSEIQHPEPIKLRQNYREQLFSFEKYKRDLLEFGENRRGSPDYTIYLCFGEKLPDGKPLEKKLIVVKVVPLICRELNARAQADGASSLHNDNVSLQISHNSLFDLINSLGPPSMDMCL